jgi:hypothetical protein
MVHEYATKTFLKKSNQNLYPNSIHPAFELDFEYASTIKTKVMWLA